jgi:hypothetical protein
MSIEDNEKKSSKELGFKRKATFTFQVQKKLKTVDEILDGGKKYF